MTTSTLKPFILHTTPRGPNPAKVVIILHELSLPYIPIFTEFIDIKSPAFTAINPNGRAPALTDPNNSDFTIWESGAIIQYLIARYDPIHKLTHGPNTPEYFLEAQWLFFQMSGQGPYFGQAMWFSVYHHEQLPSARDRYLKEIRRVTAVRDRVLEGREWLVGDKCTYADLAFVAADTYIPRLMEMAGLEWEPEKEFPNYARWRKALEARESVKKAIEEFKLLATDKVQVV